MMDLDEFIKNAILDKWVVPGDASRQSYTIKGDTPIWAIRFAEALQSQDESMREFIKTEHTKLLECMPCSCDHSLGDFDDMSKELLQTIKCPRCKLLEERKLEGE